MRLSSLRPLILPMPCHTRFCHPFSSFPTHKNALHAAPRPQSLEAARREAEQQQETLARVEADLKKLRNAKVRLIGMRLMTFMYMHI